VALRRSAGRARTRDVWYTFGARGWFTRVVVTDAIPPGLRTSDGAGARQDNRRMMIRVWEYDVSEAAVPNFERIYGADGAWAQLFSSSDGFKGTELFASVSNSGRYLTVDRFRDEASWRRFMVEHREAYLALDAESEGLTVAERELVGPDTD
jgi:heme-degrading monooxygenase HmoA